MTELTFWLVDGILIAFWLKGSLNRILLSPQRAWLAIKTLRCRPPKSGEGFRLVLCWLGNDADGNATRAVEQAFTGVEGIGLVRSWRVVASRGAADEWQPNMRKSARRILNKWRADLAVAGVVKE